MQQRRTTGNSTQETSQAGTKKENKNSTGKPKWIKEKKRNGVMKRPEILIGLPSRI